MANQFEDYEPLPDHLADTGPIRRVDVIPGWRRAVGFASLIGAAALTLGTAFLLLTSGGTPAPDSVPPTTSITDAPLTATTAPNTVAPTQAPAQVETLPNSPAGIPPTLNPDNLASLLSTPIAPVKAQLGFEVMRNDYSAFTIIPDRPRSEVIQYEVKSGDTIFQIADRFGLKPESIAWANDRTLVEGLRPGRSINILPVDGVYWTVQSEQSIASIAQRFLVDPYAIIDSEFNSNIFGVDVTPATILPSGTHVVIPGGVDAAINWNPPVQREAASGSNSSGGSSGGRIAFDISDPGSCGWVDNPGGGGGWVRPIGSYQFVRGFTSFHSGVDLSAQIGTPITAANGGTVIFAGWSNWGYGWSVVLAHGPFTTLYGHMSDVYARCGTYVSAGQVIGAVGSSGDSTGPHLHFEIRYNDIPTDPTSTIPF